MLDISDRIVESALREKVNDWVAKNGPLITSTALEIVMDFFLNYKIENVDATIQDNDVLFFEYGIYDWQDGKGENFTIGIGRQYYAGDEDYQGFSQVHTILYFNCDQFRTVKSASLWSIDFGNVEEWKDSVKKSDAFILTSNENPNSFDVFLSRSN